MNYDGLVVLASQFDCKEIQWLNCLYAAAQDLKKNLGSQFGVGESCRDDDGKTRPYMRLLEPTRDTADSRPLSPMEGLPVVKGTEKHGRSCKLSWRASRGRAGSGARARARVLSVPAGGESTGLHAVDELNGWTYIMSNFQHAGDWGAAHVGVKATLDPPVRANYKDKFGAAVGYLMADVSQVKLAKG